MTTTKPDQTSRKRAILGWCLLFCALCGLSWSAQRGTFRPVHSYGIVTSPTGLHYLYMCYSGTYGDFDEAKGILTLRYEEGVQKVKRYAFPDNIVELDLTDARPSSMILVRGTNGKTRYVIVSINADEAKRMSNGGLTREDMNKY